jgi:hypothetical protein
MFRALRLRVIAFTDYNLCLCRTGPLEKQNKTYLEKKQDLLGEGIASV